MLTNYRVGAVGNSRRNSGSSDKSELANSKTNEQETKCLLYKTL